MDRSRQVIAAWPFINQGREWSPKRLVAVAHRLQLGGVELLDVEHWPLLQKYGLVCAATRSHTFVRGMNNKNHHPECFAALERAIEATARAGFPNVMTFTGLLDTSDHPSGSVVDREQAFQNCVQGYKSIVSKAEKEKVTLVLEPLNTKVNLPMKGHPGYSAGHIADCIRIIEAVGSPALKLLFDVYHIQIMDGDLIAHIRSSAEYIAHVQVAGVPGRGALSMRQEINYAAIMASLDEIGYQGYVGHEWLPGRRPIKELKQSIYALT
ncbi:MAG: TIM barrel protein [Saprospiraceae bacterium]|nr:TIM barrel protein [Saprospiraceae bacterium]